MAGARVLGGIFLVILLTALVTSPDFSTVGGSDGSRKLDTVDGPLSELTRDRTSEALRAPQMLNEGEGEFAAGATASPGVIEPVEESIEPAEESIAPETVEQPPESPTTTVAEPAPPATTEDLFAPLDLPAKLSLVAQARGASVPIFATVGAGEVNRTLANPTPNGGPLVFLVKDQSPGWFEVYLPVRPNGSTGWIRETDVSLTQHTYQIVVQLEAHRIAVYKGDELVMHEPVGVGKNNTPTPGGVFYLKELLQPPRSNGPYGPYAYGLSGFSNTLTRFNGGPGVIGIHGTNNPDAIGRDVSSGCIRLHNDAISELAKFLPLGTPVSIVA